MAAPINGATPAALSSREQRTAVEPSRPTDGPTSHCQRIASYPAAYTSGAATARWQAVATKVVTHWPALRRQRQRILSDYQTFQFFTREMLIAPLRSPTFSRLLPARTLKGFPLLYIHSVSAHPQQLSASGDKNPS